MKSGDNNHKSLVAKDPPLLCPPQRRRQCHGIAINQVNQLPSEFGAQYSPSSRPGDSRDVSPLYLMN